MVILTVKKLSAAALGFALAAGPVSANSSVAGAPRIETPNLSTQGMLLAETADDLFLDVPEEESSEDAALDDVPEEEPSEDAARETTTTGAPPTPLNNAEGVPPDPLFEPEQAAAAVGQAPATVGVGGFVQNELAYTYTDPDHFSKFRTRARLKLSGALNARTKWQVSGSFFYDPIFEIEDRFYPDRVEDDQKLDGWIDESFVDIDADAWEFRVGRQHIIWGEMVGLFFADVVSALDLREFILPDFDLIRIPQWAARAEYFSGDFHAEFIYIPVVTKDNLGEFGGDYRPNLVALPAGVSSAFMEDKMLNDPGEDFGAGTRVSYLNNGWDLSAFYYSSPNKTATFARQLFVSSAGATVLFKPTHDRIHQFGGTLAKDFGAFVLKSEAVQTLDRQLSVFRSTDFDGLADTDELRYVVGIDWAGGTGHSVNVQFFQTWFQQHDSNMAVKELESGASIFLTTTSLHPDITPEVLWIRSLDRNEWLLEAKVTWEFARNWRGVLGADIFEGQQNRLLGQFNNSDRVYYELRYSF